MAALFEGEKIGAGSGMAGHVHVHRGGKNDRGFGGQVCGREKVVSEAVGELGESVRSGRSDDQYIGPLGLRDVLDGVAHGL